MPLSTLIDSETDSEFGIRAFILPVMKQLLMEHTTASASKASCSSSGGGGGGGGGGESNTPSNSTTTTTATSSASCASPAGVDVYFICRRGVQSQLATRLFLDFLQVQRSRTTSGGSSDIGIDFDGGSARAMRVLGGRGVPVWRREGANLCLKVEREASNVRLVLALPTIEVCTGREQAGTESCAAP